MLNKINKKIKTTYLIALIFIVITAIGCFEKPVEVSPNNKKFMEKYEEFTIPDLGMKFVGVEAGSFKMGDNDGLPSEKPMHKVTLTKSFAIGKYEVTVSEYQKIMNEKVSHHHNTAVNTEWKNCVRFCKKLTKREQDAGRIPKDYVYRLPTEAEWEYAAKGGNKSEGYKYSGSDDLESVTTFESTNIGEKEPNELGIYDMTGSSLEYCSDLATLVIDPRHNDYSKAPTSYSVAPNYTADEQINPFGEYYGQLRIIKGGGYLKSMHRPSSRYWENVGRNWGSGFRVVLAQSREIKKESVKYIKQIKEVKKELSKREWLKALNSFKEALKVTNNNSIIDRPIILIEVFKKKIEKLTTIFCVNREFYNWKELKEDILSKLDSNTVVYLGFHADMFHWQVMEVLDCIKESKLNKVVMMTRADYDNYDEYKISTPHQIDVLNDGDISEFKGDLLSYVIDVTKLDNYYGFDIKENKNVYHINGGAYHISQYEDFFKQIEANNPPVIINCGPNARHRKLIKLLDILNKTSIKNIAVINDAVFTISHKLSRDMNEYSSSGVQGQILNLSTIKEPQVPEIDSYEDVETNHK